MPESAPLTSVPSLGDADLSHGSTVGAAAAASRGPHMLLYAPEAGPSIGERTGSWKRGMYVVVLRGGESFLADIVEGGTATSAG